MSEILFRSLLTLALGCLLALPLIYIREIGRGFFTFWVATVGVLGAIALWLRLSGLVPASTQESGIGSDWTVSLLALALGLLVAFWIVLRMGALRVATAVLLGSVLTAGLALREIAAAPGNSTALQTVTFILSALVVGVVTVAMVLGHWYLVQPKLAVAPLRRMCNVFIGVLLARLVVSAWGFTMSLEAGRRFVGVGEPIPWELLILSQRLLFGFGGAIILAIMIRKTVALRSTMAATGLLYIAILFVWVGEFLSIYLGRLSEGALVV